MISNITAGFVLHDGHIHTRSQQGPLRARLTTRRKGISSPSQDVILTQVKGSGDEAGVSEVYKFQVPGREGVVRERGAKQVSATQGRCPGIEATHSTTTTSKDGHTVRYHTTMHSHTANSICEGISSAAPECEVTKRGHCCRQIFTHP